MKTENLIGIEMVKNYKGMCDLLDEDVKTGKSKILQLENWKRYFDYENDGHKFIIKKVYDLPIEKTDNRKINNKGNNSKYIEEIKDILVDYIYKERDINGKVELSFSKLIGILGLANNTYLLANYRKKELSDILNIQLKAIYYFYNSTRCEFKNIIERALNNLQKRSVIHYNKIIKIAEKKPSETKDKKDYISYRQATSDEVILILDAQRLALEEMGLLDFQSLFLAGNAKYKEYLSIVMGELPKQWLFYFNAYELIVGAYAIKSEYNMNQRKLELNNKSIERISTSLKVCNENDTEKKLIDILVDLLKHDFGLDNKIIELYEAKKQEKYNKIKENINVLISLHKKENEVIQDNEMITKLYDERDKISKYDLYSYSQEIKNKDEVFDDFIDFDGLF